MNILGLEIKKANTYKFPKDKEFEEQIDDCINMCNNQLRGNINEKARSYNKETLNYYIGLITDAAIDLGMKLEKDREKHQKLDT